MEFWGFVCDPSTCVEAYQDSVNTLTSQASVVL